MTGPRFSVIITTFNRPASLARTLAALARADYPHSEFEVIVVDDGGSEPLDEIVAGCSTLTPVRLGPFYVACPTRSIPGLLIKFDFRMTREWPIG